MKLLPPAAYRRLNLVSGCLAILIVVLPLSAFAQTNGAGSTSTNFQKIGMGARASAMGDSFTAVSDDATAMFWNPAGLVLAKGTQFNLTHGEWLLGVTHEFFAFSQNLDNDGAFGGSLGYMGTGSFPGALEIPGVPIESSYGGVGDNISSSDYIGSLAYAQRLGNWIGGSSFFQKSILGIKATAVGQNIVNVGSSGLAFDAGYIYEVSRKTFYLAAVASNIGTQFQGTVVANGVTVVQNYSQPVIFKFGGSYRFTNLLMKKDRNIIAMETDGHIDTGLKFDIGDEYRLAFGRNAVAFRAGYRTGSDLGALAGLTSGVGISHRFDDFEAGLDYAFVPYGVLGETHRISLNVIIGVPLIIPEAYLNVTPAFVLGQQKMDVAIATKSEEPIDKWKMTITDSSGMLVKTLSGKGAPSSRFSWDGKNEAGDLVPQGNYTFNLEVTDTEESVGKSRPRETFAKWVPKRVPYQYTFGVSGDLLFDSGKDVLLQKGYDAIQKTAAAIQLKYPDSLIIIAGHTDDQKLGKGAKFADNQKLSLARAQAVMDYLVKNGVNSQKLSVIGYGDTKPIADNKTPAGRAKNRRVELVVSGVMDASTNEMIDEGLMMMKNKRTREALDRFLKAIEADSRNAKAYHLAGDCYLLLGGKDLAAASYRKALKWNPADTALKAWLDQYAPAPQPVLSPSNGAAPLAPLPALPNAPANPSSSTSQAPAPSSQASAPPPAVPTQVPAASANQPAPAAAPAAPGPVPVEAN